MLCCTAIRMEPIKALVGKYADILNINPQVVVFEMELFSRTENEITFDVIQKEMTEDVYPHYYRMRINYNVAARQRCNA